MGWRWVLKFMVDIFNVSWHGHLGCSGFVVPDDGGATVELACPVCFDWVEISQGLLWVHIILFVLAGYTKVIHHQTKGDWVGGVFPQTVGVGGLTTPKLGQAFCCQFVNQHASLWWVMHDFLDLDADLTVML